MAEREVYPVNPLPAVVIALFAVIMGVEGLFQLGMAGLSAGRRRWAGGFRRSGISGFRLPSGIRSWWCGTFRSACCGGS